MSDLIKDLGHDDIGCGLDDPARPRCWMALLYPDNEDMLRILTEVIPSLDWNYVGRIHDQEGKAHHHVVFVFKDGHTCSAVSKALGLDPRWLRPWDRKKKAIRYLCHCDNPEKYQYSPDGLYGTLADDACGLCAKSSVASESQTVSDILALLDSLDYVTFTDFVRLAAEKGFWSTFRRMGAMGSRLIDEHNAIISDKRRSLAVLADAQHFNDSVASGQNRQIPFDIQCDILEKNGFPSKPL